MAQPALFIFSGLPGVGKTTLARALAKRLGAVYLRVDTVEVALARSTLAVLSAEDAGYEVSYAIAADNLRQGMSVVADSVNPLAITRCAWRNCATSTGATFRDIEITCSNQKEHQRRVESRTSDIQGHELPTWQEVLSRDIDPWTTERLQIDTARNSPDDSAETLFSQLGLA